MNSIFLIFIIYEIYRLIINHMFLWLHRVCRTARLPACLHMRVLFYYLSTTNHPTVDAETDCTPPPGSMKTVQDVFESAVVPRTDCTTKPVAGLTRQLVKQMNCLNPGMFARMAESPEDYTLQKAVLPAPYLQTAVLDMVYEAAAKGKKQGKKMEISSLLRTVVQQFLLYKWQAS